ncbi:MAG: hypothetical protein Q7R97_00005, partial [Candidatus Daviesbacteria bacterium]|nr:hypothetical protein [Candidatus Daviesbacteria bacterium]
MNWKNNLGLKSALFILIVTLSIFLVLASALMMLALYDGYKQQNNDSKEKQEKEQVLQETLIKKESLYLEMSPLDTRKVITYKVSNEPFFKDYMMIVAQEKNNPKEEPLFIGEERIGIPQWLDDDHIIFTSYCGTSCKGIYLID